MKKDLYLVRHGQTLFNQKKYIQGWCDSSLTELGKSQARAVGSYFRQQDIQFDAAYCSTLGRTEATLKEIVDLPYTRLEDLKEFGFGLFEGESTQLILSHGKDLLHTSYEAWGGESPKQVRERMMRALDTIVQEEGTTILVVAHGANLMNLMEAIDPKKAQEVIRFVNGVIYHLEYEDGRFTIIDSVVPYKN